MTQSNVSFPGYLAAMLLLLAFFVAYMMRTYASTNRRLFPVASYPTIFLAYYCSLAIVLIVPLDVSLTVFSRKAVENEADYDNKSKLLVKMYVTFFLITQIGYNGLTFQEKYNKSGFFTVKTKIIDTVRYLALMGTVGLVAGVIFFTILVTTKVVDLSIEAVILTIVLLSNTFGLAVLMILLGYGLVSFPQMLWMKGNLQRQLNQTLQQNASRHKNFVQCEFDMKNTHAIIQNTAEELKLHPSDDPAVNEAILLIVKESATTADFNSANSTNAVARDKNNNISIQALGALRSQLYYKSSAYEMAKGKLEEAKIKAFYYQDVLESKDRSDNIKRIKWSLGPESTERGYKFHVYVRPFLFRIAAVLCILMSIFCFLGVIGTMHGVGRSTSVFATVVHADSTSPAGICMFVMFTLLYPAYVTMWSIFQMKIASVMELLPGQKTTAPSLSVNSRAVIRLSTPLVFFYLGWIFENGIKDGDWLDGAVGGTVGDDDAGANRIMMSFAKFYQVEVIPVMGGSFNTLFPIIMFSVSGLVLFNLFNRFLVFINCGQFQFGTEILSDAELREGLRQLTSAKRLRERRYQRGKLRDIIDGNGKAVKSLNIFSNIFGFVCEEKESDKKYTNGDVDEDIEKGQLEQQSQMELPVLQGWAEKKGQKKFGVSGGWQPRYFNVVKPGRLVYFKDASMDGEPNGELNLALVMSFNLTTKDDGDKDDSDAKFKLELDMADKSFKMRFPNIDEATKWQVGLASWKEYAIANCDDDDGENTSSDDGVQLGNLYGSEESSSNEDETAALTKNMKSSSAPSSSSPSNFTNTRQHETQDFSMEISDRPSDLEGWLEKKQQSKFGGKMAQWQKRFFKVDEKTGSLLYFKSTNPKDTAAGRIDLRMIVDVAAPEKDGKVDAVRFNIDMGDKVYKIRAPSTTEGERWIVLLNMWREYIILK